MDQTPYRRAGRAFRPQLDGLERRELQATAVSTLMVRPALLSPPNNRFLRVEISGNVIESNAKVRPRAVFYVIDEYRRFQPQGRVTLTKITPTVYTFSFSVVLQAKRADSDLSGRQYNIIVGAQDDQNAQGLAVTALVPYRRVNAAALTVSEAHSRKRRWQKS